MEEHETDAAANERQQRAHFAARIRRIFSTDKRVREDAQEALKESWGYDLPSLRIEELSDFPAENCNLLSAKRDGNKEIVTWLIALSNSITTES